jgi:hypothetical protein
MGSKGREFATPRKPRHVYHKLFSAFPYQLMSIKANNAAATTPRKRVSTIPHWESAEISISWGTYICSHHPQLLPFHLNQPANQPASPHHQKAKNFPLISLKGIDGSET